MSQIHLTVNRIDNVKGDILREHYNPEELSPAEIAKGFLVDSLPVAERKIGKVAVMYWSYKDNYPYFEYEDNRTIEEIFKETIENLQQDNAQLLKENVKKDAIIESLSKDIADIYKMIGGNK